MSENTLPPNSSFWHLVKDELKQQKIEALDLSYQVCDQVLHLIIMRQIMDAKAL